MTSRTQVLLISSAIGRSRAKRGAKSPWVYELLLPDPLLILDLLISIKSRFLSRAAPNRFNRFVARRKAIGLAGFASLVSYSLVITTRAEVGQICAIASTLLLAPTIIAAVALFRCDAVKLLLRSYDFWFATVINTSTLAVFAVMMGDVHFLIPISTWTSIQVDIMIDASLRAVKVWQFLNVVGVVTHTMTWATVSLQVTDRLRMFPVFRYKSHELPSSSFATSGLATLIAIIIRNVYRKHQESSDRSNRSLIECTLLRLKANQLSMWNYEKADLSCSNPECSQVVQSSVQHLFWECPKAKLVWNYFYALWAKIGITPGHDPAIWIFSLDLPDTPRHAWTSIKRHIIGHKFSNEHLQDHLYPVAHMLWRYMSASLIQAIWCAHLRRVDSDPIKSTAEMAIMMTRLEAGMRNLTRLAEAQAGDSDGHTVAAVLKAYVDCFLSQTDAIPLTPNDTRGVYLLFFDGGSRGNPGPGGTGSIIVRVHENSHTASLIWAASMANNRKDTTNNFAEYWGLIHGLREAQRSHFEPLYVIGDSALIISQQRMHRSPRQHRLARLYQTSRRLADCIDIRGWYHHYRAFNKMADSAANLAMDTRTSTQRLLVATYDFWFFTFINTYTHTVPALLVGDVRAVAILVAWFGIQLNIFGRCESPRCQGSGITRDLDIGFRQNPDLVFWQGEVFGETAQFRLMPFFYNCFATALVFVFHLLWRLVRNDFDVPLVLDGAVTYKNYLRKTKGQVSRRYGSYLQQRNAQKAAPPHQDLVLVPRSAWRSMSQSFIVRSVPHENAKIERFPHPPI
ncbi:reverse transcriptase, partial [Globisporangium splendens]